MIWATTCSLDFLGVHREVKECELEDRLISHLKFFLLELGRDIRSLRLNRKARSSFSRNCIRGTIRLRMQFNQIHQDFLHAISAPQFH